MLFFLYIERQMSFLNSIILVKLPQISLLKLFIGKSKR